MESGNIFLEKGIELMKHVPVIFHLSINDMTSVILSLSLLCLFSRMLKQSQSGVSLSCIKVEHAEAEPGWRRE